MERFVVRAICDERLENGCLPFLFKRYTSIIYLNCQAFTYFYTYFEDGSLIKKDLKLGVATKKLRVI